MLRILETPIVDILLILLAIRFIWPGLFGIRKKKPLNTNHSRHRNFVNNTRSPTVGKTPKDADAQGEYIDYEEIK
ncbi:MAG: hypothetical protein ABIO46_09610 [Chitinophagales bacterium]